MLANHTLLGWSYISFVAKPLDGCIILKGGLWSGHPVVTQSYEECMKLRTKRMKSFTGLKKLRITTFSIDAQQIFTLFHFFCVYNCKRFKFLVSNSKITFNICLFFNPSCLC